METATRRQRQWLCAWYVCGIIWIYTAVASVVDSDLHVQATLDAPALQSDKASRLGLFDKEELVEWAARMGATTSLKPGYHVKNEEPVDVFLIVGVKTSVVHNFKSRQAIRQSWAKREELKPLGVRVVFLGCSPDFSSFTNASERGQIQRAIEMEKKLFEDLLTQELQCVDSYFRLVEKTTSLKTWVVANVLPLNPTLQYVMLADDDVFVNVDRLVAMLRRDETPKSRYYAGSVRPNVSPMRDPLHKNSVAGNLYPMTKFPPFAGGPHYIASGDIVRFVAKNKDKLKGVGTNEDVTMSYWLFALLRLSPVNIPEFENLQTAACREDLIAFADVSHSAIRLMHDNIAHNRSLCDGLTRNHAMRSFSSLFITGNETDSTSDDTASLFSWKLQHDKPSNLVQIEVTIDAGAQQVSYLYKPSTTTYRDGLCVAGAMALQGELYILVGESFCQYHRRKLQSFLDETIATQPAMRALVALPRHNLARESYLDDTKLVALAPGVKYARVIVECRFVDMFPSTQILVLDDVDVGSTQTPDFFIFSEADGGTGSTSTRRLGANTKLIRISSLRELESHEAGQSVAKTTDHVVEHFIPAVSSLFGQSVQHSPLRLLQPRRTTETAGGRLFCGVVDMACDPLQDESQSPLSFLSAIGSVTSLYHCEDALSTRRDEPFSTDLLVSDLQQFKFVAIVESPSEGLGSVLEAIAAVFLAGSVPIYTGSSAIVSRLFNPRALIHCGEYDSLRSCAHVVEHAHESQDAYEALKREPPVTNTIAFYETFSWHPDVVEWMEAQSEDRSQLMRASHMLLQLIK